MRKDDYLQRKTTHKYSIEHSHGIMQLLFLK